MDNSIPIGITNTVVVETNPLRQRIILANYSNELIWISQSGLARADYGIPIGPSGGSYEDEPDATGYMWRGPYFAICATGGKILSVTEHNRVT